MTAASESDEERVASFFDGYAAKYDTTYLDRVCQAEDRHLMRTLAPMVRRARRVMDLGCGTGWMLDQFGPRLRPPYAEWEGQDISRGMLQRLVTKHPWAANRVHVGDMNEWKAKRSESYDLITSIYESPSFVQDVEQFSHRVMDALTPGGQFLFVPHGLGDEGRVPYYGEDGHAGSKPWTERATIDAFTGAGAKDVRVVGMRHPQMGPAETSNRIVHDLWLRLETKLFRPDAMVFLIVTGTK